MNSLIAKYEIRRNPGQFYYWIVVEIGNPNGMVRRFAFKRTAIEWIMKQEQKQEERECTQDSVQS